MFNKIYNWFTLPVEKKSVEREIIEIVVLYLLFSVIVIVQDEIPIQLVLLSVLLLVGMIWESVRELLRVALLAGIIVFGIVRPFVVQAFYIPSRSMENTLQVNDHIFVNKFIYRFVNPSRWDIIVFQYPRDPSKDYIKRLVGLSGDTIAVSGNQVYINGSAVEQRVVSGEVELYFFRSAESVILEESGPALRFSGDGFNINDQQVLGGQRSIDSLRARSRLSRIVREADNHSIKKEAVAGNDSRNENGRGDYGPIYIPEPGETVRLADLNRDALNCYINYMRQHTDQRVYLRNGTVYRGGQPVEEIEIEEELYFVLGDNRDFSEDSRVWGFVPASRLQGRAFLIYWPISRMGRIVS